MASKALRNAGVLALFSLLTALWFRGWLPDLGHHLIGPPEDNMQDFWNSWYAAVSASKDMPFFTRLIRFPEGTPLYYHSFAYVQLAAVKLLSFAFNPEGDVARLVVIHNLTLLASFPLAALGAYHLARHLTKSAAAGLVAGFVFAFNPSHIEHVMHHAHVSSIEFIPFFALCYLRAIEERRWGWVLAAALCNALAALGCWYYLFYDGYFICFHAAYLLCRDRKLDIAVPSLVIAGSVLLLSPLLLPMIRDGLANPAVYAAGSDACVADLLAYFLFPPFHLLSALSLPFYGRLTGNEWEDTIYLGAANLALLLWLAIKRPSGLLLYLLLGMAFFCVIASGDSLHLAGDRIIAMPGALLSQLPFVRNVRTPARAIVYVYLFLSVAVGYGVALLWRERRAWAALAVALLLIDAWPVRLPATPFVCSPAWQVLRDDSDPDFAVLDLPGFDPTSFSSYVAGNYDMMQQACHGRPILQGNTARDVAASLRNHLDMGDLNVQQHRLTDAKVKYIVVTRPQGQPFSWQDIDLFSGAESLLPVYRGKFGTVYDGADRTIFKVY